MAFAIQEPKTITKWVDFIGEKNEKQGSFKIRGIKYPKYQVELDRINNIYANGKYVDYKGVELTHNQAIFQLVAEYLIVDWQNVAVEQNDEITTVPYTAETAFNIMRWGKDLTGASLAGWVIGQASNIQHEADNYTAEVVGKSENFTDGQNLVNKQPKKPKKSST